MTSIVDRAIEEALGRAAGAYAEKGIRVDLALNSFTKLDTYEEALYEAVRAVFLALPSRLDEGAQLQVRTTDKAGGDIELSIRIRDGGGAPREVAGPAAPEGPSDDILGLALLGLAVMCRMRSALASLSPDGAEREYVFLIPSLVHGGPWMPER